MYGQVLKAPSGFIAQSGPAGVGDDISDQYAVRLSPISTVIKFSDITIYRIGGGMYPLTFTRVANPPPSPQRNLISRISSPHPPVIPSILNFQFRVGDHIYL